MSSPGTKQPAYPWSGSENQKNQDRRPDASSADHEKQDGKYPTRLHLQTRKIKVIWRRTMRGTRRKRRNTHRWRRRRVRTTGSSWRSTRATSRTTGLGRSATGSDGPRSRGSSRLARSRFLHNPLDRGPTTRSRLESIGLPFLDVVHAWKEHLLVLVTEGIPLGKHLVQLGGRSVRGQRRTRSQGESLEHAILGGRREEKA